MIGGRIRDSLRDGQPYWAAFLAFQRLERWASKMKVRAFHSTILRKYGWRMKRRGP